MRFLGCVSATVIAAAIAVALLASCQVSDASSAFGKRDASSDAVPVSAFDAGVHFSRESGAYPEGLFRLMLKNRSGLPIVYTTDGSLPTPQSERAPEVLTLTGADTNRALVERLAAEIPDFRTIVADADFPTATVIRAAALLPDGTVGPVSTNTYFIGQSLPGLFGDAAVVSLVVAPEDLLDYNTGIMAKGAIYDKNLAQNSLLGVEDQYLVQANYSQKGRDWEREGVVEFFDGSDGLSCESPCGVRLRGYMSRVYAQKSFSVYFREDYGAKSLDYDLFDSAATTSDGSPITSFKGFCLRSGGNDTETLRFRDSLFQEQLGDLQCTTQATRPAILFLNGEFYGVYSLNEKYSDSYIESHYGVDSDNVVIFEDGELDEGEDEDVALYEQLMEFAGRDLSQNAAWKEFCEVVDAQSMADFYAAQIYIGNVDFSEIKNYRVWRAREHDPSSSCGDTRWRFMLYDLEYSTGLYAQAATQPDFDTVGVYLETCPLFASAMRNSEFSAMVRDRLVGLSEGPFEVNRISDMLGTWWTKWEPWIRMSAERFETSSDAPKQALDGIREFFAERPSLILDSYDKNATKRRP